MSRTALWKAIGMGVAVVAAVFVADRIPIWIISHRQERIAQLVTEMREKPTQQGAVIEIGTYLADDERLVRGSAVRGLLAVATNPAVPKNVVDQIVRMLASELALHSSRDAAIALRNLGPKAKSALPELLSEVRAPRSDAAWFSVEALVRLGADPNDILPALISTLDYANQYGTRSPCVLCITAANALQELGPSARPALPALYAHLNTADDEFREAALNAIRVIEGPR